MPPLPFVWPYWPIFWAVFVWSFLPESRIVRTAQKATARPDSQDAGSVKVITVGLGLASFAAFPLAAVRALRLPSAWQPTLFVVGVAVLIGGSLLRRHCWRMLGSSFTGDVRARPDQVIVGTGAYTLLRHPSYSAGILMNIGIGLALGSWASIALLTIASFAVYHYRMAVEERALIAVVGEPYREYMRTRRRLIPFVY
jgi:protein-S-isoprenylcysteine O-methyltransferase Ste14